MTIEIEEQLLSTFLVSPDSWFGAKGLVLEMFTIPPHRQIFQSINSVLERDTKFDIVTVGECLEEKSGGSWVARLVDMCDRNVAVPENVQAYSDILIRAHRKALERHAAERYLRDVNDGDDDALGRLMTAVAHPDDDHETEIKDSLVKVVERVDDLAEGRIAPGVKSGIDKLDSITGEFQRGDLIILAARTSVGKTAVACNFALNVPGAVGFVSAEQNALQLTQRMISMRGQVSLSEMRTGKVRDWAAITTAVESLHQEQILIYDKPMPTIEEVTQVATRWKFERDIQILFVDYLQYIQSSAGDAKHERVADVSGKLKALARRLDIPVVTLAQVNRNVESRQTKIPGLSDLRDSGDIEQDADMVIFVYRESIYSDVPDNEIQFIVAKHRNGPIGRCIATWVPERMLVTNAANQGAII